MKQSGPAALLVMCAIAGALYLSRNANFGPRAPEFSLPASYGGEVSLASYRGHKVLLLFWTTSCGICRRELPLLNQMEPELMQKGVSVLAIHLGDQDIRDYLRTNGINLLSLVDADGSVGQAYHVSGVPKLVLIGEDGKVKHSRAGMAGEATLRDWSGSSN